jgi:hypothetical protein
LAAFIVLESSDHNQSWWLTALGVALLLAIILTVRRALRHRRDLRWVRHHVRVTRWEASEDRSELSPSRLDPRSADIAVRIEPHADIGTHSLEEIGQ